MVCSVATYALFAYSSKLAQEYAWTSMAPVDKSDSLYHPDKALLLADSSPSIHSSPAADSKRESTFSYHNLHLNHHKSDSNSSNDVNPQNFAWSFAGYENVPSGFGHNLNQDQPLMLSEDTSFHVDHQPADETAAEPAPPETYSLSFPRDKLQSTSDSTLNRMSSYASYDDPYYRDS